MGHNISCFVISFWKRAALDNKGPAPQQGPLLVVIIIESPSTRYGAAGPILKTARGGASARESAPVI